MGRVKLQCNETWHEMWHEMQSGNTTPVKTNGSKTSTFFEKVGNIISPR